MVLPLGSEPVKPKVTDMGTGTPPAPWAHLIAEFMVTDYDRTLSFWTNILGFSVSFARPAQKLACLTRPEGAQVMFYERDGYWETGLMEQPFGRGAITQVFVSDVDALSRKVSDAGLPFYVAPREKWRDWGDRLGGQREFLVQDPDGYLIMVAQRIGERPLPQS
jgi:catechol 2,3-dioxygenase-like lactoylglutathione lyase family enzyme